MFSIGGLLKATLLFVNAFAVLDEKRFLSQCESWHLGNWFESLTSCFSLDGYDRIDVEGINTGALKSQVSEFLRMCRMLRSKYLAINSLKGQEITHNDISATGGR